MNVSLAHLRWYVVHTKPCKESMVNGLLQHQGFETLYPHYWGTVKHARRVKDVIKPYFSRYLFVGKCDWQGMGTINDTLGVSTVLYLGDEPLQLSDKVMDSIRANCGEDGRTDAPKETPDPPVFQKGDIVKIIEGPLQGFEATVAVDKRGAVRVMLDMFRGEFPVTVPSGGLILIHPQCVT